MNEFLKSMALFIFLVCLSLRVDAGHRHYDAGRGPQIVCSGVACMGFSVVFEDSDYCAAIAFPLDENRRLPNKFTSNADIYLNAKLGKRVCDEDEFFFVYGHEVELVARAISILDDSLEGRKNIDVSSLEPDDAGCILERGSVSVAKVLVGDASPDSGDLSFLVEGCGRPMDVELHLENNSIAGKLRVAYARPDLDLGSVGRPPFRQNGASRGVGARQMCAAGRSCSWHDMRRAEPSLAAASKR